MSRRIERIASEAECLPEVRLRLERKARAEEKLEEFISEYGLSREDAEKIFETEAPTLFAYLRGEEPPRHHTEEEQRAQAEELLQRLMNERGLTREEALGVLREKAPTVYGYLMPVEAAEDE